MIEFEITKLLLMSRSKYSLLRCTYSKGVGMNQREKDNCYIENRLTQISKENKTKKMKTQRKVEAKLFNILKLCQRPFALTSSCEINQQLFFALNVCYG